MASLVRCTIADTKGAAVLLLSARTCLEDLAQIHRLAPKASIHVIELEDDRDRPGFPRYCSLGWRS